MRPVFHLFSDYKDDSIPEAVIFLIVVLLMSRLCSSPSVLVRMNTVAEDTLLLYALVREGLHKVSTLASPPWRGYF